MAAQRLAESGHRPDPAHLYRYRTAALVGPWRRTHAQAMADALNAGQVRRDELGRHELRWMVDGRIEERKPDPRPVRRNPATPAHDSNRNDGPPRRSDSARGVQRSGSATLRKSP